MTEQVVDLRVRKTITVEVSPERAFAVFTEEIGSWWPLEGKSIGAAKAETAIIEPRVGGRWFEQGEDGSTCDWGRVLAYEPPERIALAWQISSDWRHDPEISSEVEVRFIAEGEERTRVELEHRGLAAAYGDQAAQMYDILDSPTGWGEILDAFVGRGEA